MNFKEYAKIWLEKRKRDFPKSTTDADSQRLRDYLIPILGDYEMKDITFSLCKHTLTKISEPGYRSGMQNISSSTRDRVKALLSVIMNSAMNEFPPLIESNPVRDIKFSERRRGKKRPQSLGRDECIAFFEAAKRDGKLQHLIASIFLMTGIRKQELIALKWNSFDELTCSLHIKEKYEQCSGKILKGTKAGENVTRTIPINRSLCQLLCMHKSSSMHTKEEDFIICNENGQNFTSSQISRCINRIREAAGVSISAHGLRHTFGREFALATGNMKVLQAILGHASSSTTDIYSDLSGKRIEGFGEAVNFEEKKK